MNTNKRSQHNNTIENLQNGESWVGEWEDVTRFQSVAVSVLSDVELDLYIEQSSTQESTEGNIRTSHSSLAFVVAANINEVHALKCMRSFARIRVVNNSGSGQTSMSLETIFGDINQLNAPMNLPLALDSDAATTRPSRFEDEVVIGRRVGVFSFTKFGYREGLTSASGEQTVWAATGNFTPLTSAETFTITYDNTADGLGQNGALTLFFQYIDANGEPAEAVHVLGNTGSDVTSFTGLGINRIAVSSSGSTDTNGAAITVTATTATTTQATIPAMGSVTQQAIYFVGSNSNAVATFLSVNATKISGGGSPRLVVKGYVYNRNVQTRYEVYRYAKDTSVSDFKSFSEPVGFRLSPSDILYFVADTDTNNTIVNIRFSLREYLID